MIGFFGTGGAHYQSKNNCGSMQSMQTAKLNKSQLKVKMDKQKRRIEGLAVKETKAFLD